MSRPLLHPLAIQQEPVVLLPHLSRRQGQIAQNPSRRGMAKKLLDALVEDEKSDEEQQRKPKAKPACT